MRKPRPKHASKRELQTELRSPVVADDPVEEASPQVIPRPGTQVMTIPRLDCRRSRAAHNLFILIRAKCQSPVECSRQPQFTV